MGQGREGEAGAVMRYPLTFYVDSLPPDVGGCANGPVIRILKKYRDRNDEGIYQHELLHVKQWFAVSVFSGLALFFLGMALTGIFEIDMFAMALLGLGVHSILSKFVPEYRLAIEVEAYKRQLRYYDDDRSELFAGFIAARYNLNITKENALKLLKGKL